MSEPVAPLPAALGQRFWLVSAGFMPLSGCGAEPSFTPHDRLSLLNTGDELANVRVHALFADAEAVGPFRLGVAARRVRQLRINDLIFPSALPLETVYGLRIASDRPVIVQFGRMDTRQRALAACMTMAWSDDACSEGRRGAGSWAPQEAGPGSA
jgi:hypothetical protein